jgi:uncharacterized protein (TIGR03435 family)
VLCAISQKVDASSISTRKNEIRFSWVRRCNSAKSVVIASRKCSPAYFRDGPVVDRTGLTGRYDLHLEWMMQQQLDAGLSGPTMYAAVEKLGLTLEKKRDMADVLIVDHCEQTPTNN